MGLHIGYLAISITLLASISMEVRGKCSIAGSFFAGLYGIERDCTDTEGRKG